MNRSKYYLVEGDMLPDIFLKVEDAKELLQTGAADTVAEAVAQVGISRSAFYKYKDAISPFQDMTRGRILTFHVLLRDKPGILSGVLSAFADCGANILTINQSIPVSGAANVTVSAETSGLFTDTEKLLQRLRDSEGVLKAEVMGG